MPVVRAPLTPLAVVARGEARADDRERHAGNGPSFFADEAAWLVASAATRAIAAAAEDVVAAPDAVGVIAMSATCTASTMQRLAATASSGVVSPLRFAGANPAVIAGLPSITLGLHGPTLVLSMPPAEALDTAALVVAAWLRDEQARYVLLAAHEAGAARCAVLRAARDRESDVTPALAADLVA